MNGCRPVGPVETPSRLPSPRAGGTGVGHVRRAAAIRPQPVGSCNHGGVQLASRHRSANGLSMSEKSRCA